MTTPPVTPHGLFNDATDTSARPCGCDPGAHHVCEWHQAAHCEALVAEVTQLRAEVERLRSILRASDTSGDDTE